MENKATTLENLYEKVEQYGATTLELYRHKAIYEIALFASSLAVKYILTIVFALVFFFASFGAAIWIGEIMTKTYYGYFTVAAFYVFLGIVIFIFRKPWIKTQVTNLVIKSMLTSNKK